MREGVIRGCFGMDVDIKNACKRPLHPRFSSLLLTSGSAELLVFDDARMMTDSARMIDQHDVV